jgi:hypothetical protein
LNCVSIHLGGRLTVDQRLKGREMILSRGRAEGSKEGLLLDSTDGSEEVDTGGILSFNKLHQLLPGIALQ